MQPEFSPIRSDFCPLCGRQGKRVACGFSSFIRFKTEEAAENFDLANSYSDCYGEWSQYECPDCGAYFNSKGEVWGSHSEYIEELFSNLPRKL